MNIRIRGDASKRFQRIVKEACEFALGHFFDREALRKISIRVVLRPDLLKTTGFRGFCLFPNNTSARNFTIHLHSSVIHPIMLLSLFHELVHIKQFIQADLTYSSSTDKYRWAGKWANFNKCHYYDLPWEIEAHGREKGLYIRWVQKTAILSKKEKGVYFDKGPI